MPLASSIVNLPLESVTALAVTSPFTKATCTSGTGRPAHVFRLDSTGEQGTASTVPVAVPVPEGAPGRWYAPHAAIRKTSGIRKAFLITRPNAGAGLEVTPPARSPVTLRGILEPSIPRWPSGKA